MDEEKGKANGEAMKMKWEKEEDNDKRLVDTDTGRIIGGVSGPSYSTDPQEWYAWVYLPERKNLGHYVTVDYAKRTVLDYWSVSPTIQTQNDEFQALELLTNQHTRVRLTAVVEDDYPSVRHDYELALRNFIEKMKANGRLRA